MQCDFVDFTRDAVPTWFRELTDQVIAFGSDYEYEMGEPVDRFGMKVDVQLERRRADSFVFLNQKSNSIKVMGQKMLLNVQEADLAPRYRITVRIDFIDVFGKKHSMSKDIHLLVAHLNYSIGAREQVLFLGDPSLLAVEIPFFERDHEARDDAPTVFIVSKSISGEVMLAFSEELDRVLDHVGRLADQ